MIWYLMGTAPRDGRMVLLWYREYLGEKNYVTAGFWDDLLREDERTWCHAIGYGDADMWAPMPAGPDASTFLPTQSDVRFSLEYDLSGVIVRTEG